MRSIERKFKLLLIAFVAIFTGLGMLGEVVHAKEGEGVKVIGDMLGGDIVKFGGEDYIILNPNTGYIFKRDSIERRAFDLRNLQEYEVGAIENIGNYLNGTWVNQFKDWEKDIIKEHEWGIGGLTEKELRGDTWRPEGVPDFTIKQMRDKEGRKKVKAKVGLISGSDYREYGEYYLEGKGYLGYPHKEWFWTITPVEKGSTGDNVWTVRKAGELHLSAKPKNSEELGVHPAMYVDKNTNINEKNEVVQYSEGEKEGGLVVNVGVTEGEVGINIPKVKSFGEYELKGKVTEALTGFEGDIMVKDYKGRGEGWRLILQATQFEKVEPIGGFVNGSRDGHKLPKGTVAIQNLEGIVKIKGKDDGTVGDYLKRKEIIDTGGVEIVNVKGGSSVGEYRIQFGEDALIVYLDSKTVRVDKENYPKQATPYKSTLKWSIVSAP